jgi:YegS/Rv2252/BmrU family lipid kinase
MEIIGFILHGKIRGKKKVKQSLINKFSADYELRFYETVQPRHAEELTGKALSEGCNFLIAVGGDGTLNEMVNGYLKTRLTSGVNASIGVLPFGTGNDFARGTGITRDINQLSEMIRLNQPRMLDAGRMEFQHPDGSKTIRYFDNIADLGIGGDVVGRVNGVHLIKTVLGGKFNFFVAILVTFLSYKHKRVKVSWDGNEWEGQVLSLVVANGRYFGSGLGIAPEAKPDDGKFELVIFANLSIIDYLLNYSRLRKAEKIIHPEVFYHRTSKVFVESGGGTVIVEADGEIEGAAPIVYTCLPGSLRFLVP